MLLLGLTCVIYEIASKKAQAAQSSTQLRRLSFVMFDFKSLY